MATESVFDTYFRRQPAPARVGLVSLGHYLYWPQFDGLKDQLLGYHAEFAAQLADLGVEVIDVGMSDSPQCAGELADRLHAADVDLVIAFLATYTPSADVMPIARRTGRPLVLAALQPDMALDYANATTYAQLCNDNICSLPEICCALRRANLEPADAIVGRLRDDPRAWGRLKAWCDIARVLRVLRRGRLGLMGHVYEGMLDMNSDPTMVEGLLGPHVEHLELDDLAVIVDVITEAQIDAQVALIRELFDFPQPGSDPIAGPVDESELRWAARVALGLEQFVERYGLDGLAYYYRGREQNANERLGCSFAVGSSLLTGRGVPIAGELDLKNCVAMLIMDRLGAGGSFAEIHPIDFGGNFVLVGHDGPHHVGIAQGKPVLRGLTVLHGKSGRGPGVEFAIRHGAITLLGLTQTADGRFRFVVAEGESLPGQIPATGNTNTRGRFGPDIADFLERWCLAGPTHHFALGVGHHAATLERLARVLGIECVVVQRAGA
ncbi:MAG: L-fucose/L-arabinose isomerase family protein [Armatimonadetes bacterium]|nr:L-fucose/L-arabinose isomerase family protein [Armatimonadota bacterium]